MADKGIKIRFDIDDLPVQSALSRIEKEGKNLAKQLKEIDRLLELDPSNVALLAQKQDILAQSIADTTKKLNVMQEKQSEIAEEHDKWLANKEAILKNAEAIEELKNKLNAAKEAHKQAQRDFDNNLIQEDKLKESAQAVENLQKELKKLKDTQISLGSVDETQYQRYITDTEALRINLQQLQTQQTSVNEAMNAGGLAAQRAAQQEQERAQAEAQARATAEAAARAEEERRQATEAARAADEEARQASQNYSEALDKLKNSANKVKDDVEGMASAVVKGITAIGAAAAAGAAASAKVGMAFTSSMSKVEALSGASADELERLKSAASEAGALTSKSASQAADALGYMALAGWDTSQMLEGLMPMIRASEAGEMDLARCSDLVTDSMSAMGIAVGDLEHYLDVCTKAQASSNTSMEQLLEAYTVCGGSLKNFNVSAEESAAVLGLLANRGTKGSEAGTALNSILVNLIGTTKSTSYALDTLGVSAFDDEGRFIGLSETLKRLKAALDEYGDDVETISKLEAKLGGKTQLDTLQKLLAGVSAEYDNLEQEITDCNGALESTSKTMQDNLSGDITSLKSALEGLGNSVFEHLEEPFRSAVQEATEQIRALRDNVSEGELSALLDKLAKSFGELLKKTAEFAADTAIPTIIKWLEWFADNSTAVTSLITGMGAAWAAWKLGTVIFHVQELVSAIIAYKTAADAAAVSQGALNAIMEMNPFVAVAAAIAALIAALGTLYIETLKTENAARDAQTRISETAQALYDEANAFKSASEEARNHCKELDDNYNTTKGLWEQVKNLCDEEGNAGENFTKVEAIINTLNSTAGTNITMVNGQIQGYKDLTETMDNYIEKARIAAQIEYLSPLYGEATAKVGGLQSQLDTVIADLEKAFDDYDKELDRLARMKKAPKGTFTDAEIQVQQKAVDILFNKTVELTDQRNALQTAVNEYNSVIDQMEGLYEKDFQISHASKSTGNTVSTQYIVDGAKEDANNTYEGVKLTYEELKEKLDGLDNDLATHKISESDYWAKRKELLENNRFEEDKEWWKAYDAVEKHYADLADAEAKAQEKAAAEAQKTANEAAKKRTDSARSEFDKLAEEYSSGEKTYEQFCAEYAAMQKRWAENSVDISEYTSKKVKDIQRSAAKAEFTALKQQYEDGIIDYETFYKEYTALVEKWSADVSTISKDTADILSGVQSKAAKEEFAALKQQYEDGIIDYDTFYKRYTALVKKWSSVVPSVSKDNSDMLKGVQSKAAKEEFAALKQQYDDGLIDYKTFYTNYKALVKKWSADIPAIAKDNAGMLKDIRTKEAQSEFDELKSLYDKGIIDYQTFCGRYENLQTKWSKRGIDLAKLTASEAEKIESSYIDGQKKQIETAEKAIDKLQSDYKSALDKLKSDRDAYFNKLFDTSGFVSKTTQKDKNGESADIFSLSDPEEAYRKLVDYEKKLEELQARGISENVMNWIKGLDMETAQNVMDTLESLSDDKLKQYSDSFDKYRDKASSMADSKFNAQVQELNDEFVDKVMDELGTIPDAAKLIGNDLVRGFIEGLLANSDDVSAAVSSFTDLILGQMKSDLDIHSPSKETKELGEHTANGFIQGLLGSDIKGAAETMTDEFLSSLAEKDPEIRKALESAFGGNMEQAVSQMNGKAFSAFDSIAGSIMNMFPALPDISKMTVPVMEVSQSVSTGSDNELMNTIVKQNETIIEKITQLAGGSLSIELRQEQEINGTLKADMNELSAVLLQKFNSTSFLTGKKVFNI